MSDAGGRLVLDEGQALLLYDGACGFCDKAVRLVLARDANDRFRFAPLQGVAAARVLVPHGVDPRALDTLHLVVNVGRADETVLSRGAGLVEVMLRMGGRWPRVGRLLAALPRAVVDAGYSGVTKLRYLLFGRLDACSVPPAEARAKFLP